MEKAVHNIIGKHQQADASHVDEVAAKREAKQLKRLHRFTLRSKAKVDGQWKLFCLMHNLEKLAHHGYAA